MHIELRQPAGNIVEQHVVSADNTELVRRKFRLIVVENVGNTVHRDRRFPASRHALHDNVTVGGFPYDLVLLLLDRGNNIAEHDVLILGKIFHQKFIRSHRIVVVVAEQPAVIYVERAL